ncbi:MAG TPA: NAD(P)H-hydrate dehydratase [Burkholderiales bacterium]|nr:NAD(P)H-hydrate dehydratase [Burkholderiales bacterium]
MAIAPLYLTAGVRELERAAGDAQPPLMERAGAAAAALAARIAPTDAKDVLVLAGPGDNGGDARIAAERLRELFFRVTVASRPQEIPPARDWALVIDGLFGIGLGREVTGDYAALVDYVNRQRCPVLALDVPSGLQADTGRVLGCAVRATHTLTFIALKPGLLTLDGPDHCGEVAVDTLGLAVEKLVPPSAWVASPALFAGVLRPRPRNFHKGQAGSLGILGGAPGMTGAALLAGRAALKLGAGRVYVGFLGREHPLDPLMPELMVRHADEVLGLDLDALVVGPGLGTTGHAETLLGAALASELPCVLDADALNILAESDDLRSACLRRRAETLLTPHPAEAARLLGRSTPEVQADRVAAAQALAKRFNAHAVLKGNGSVIAARDGHWFVNASGHPGMASAGMGDVLSGLLGALLAQRFSGESSLVLGVHLHGAAADALAASGTGPVGLTASEVIDSARRLWNTWLRESRSANPSEQA